MEGSGKESKGRERWGENGIIERKSKAVGGGNEGTGGKKEGTGGEKS